MAVSVMEILLIGVVILVPLALLVALFAYLRRTAPEGTVRVEGAAAPPEETGPVRGSRTCTRCGVTVKPQRAQGASLCPNCGSFLAV